MIIIAIRLKRNNNPVDNIISKELIYLYIQRYFISQGNKKKITRRLTIPLIIGDYNNFNK